MIKACNWFGEAMLLVNSTYSPYEAVLLMLHDGICLNCCEAVLLLLEYTHCHCGKFSD